MKKGLHTKNKPDLFSKKDISIGKKIIKELKENNTGQAVVVSKGKVFGVDDQKGTDSMLNRVNKTFKNNQSQYKRQGILLKFPKSNQDLKIDLPTVGFKTIKKCAKIGLKGIVVKSNQNILLDKEKSIKFANKNKMFICAI